MTYHREIQYDRETRDYAMYLSGELVGFASTYHQAEVTLDQLVFELLIDGHFATAEQLDGGMDDDVPTDNPDVDSTPTTEGPSPLRQPMNCFTCGDEGDCPDCDPFSDPRTEDEKRASVEDWAEFAPCEGYPFGGWEKAHVHPFDDTRTVMVRKPRLFATVGPSPLRSPALV